MTATLVTRSTLQGVALLAVCLDLESVLCKPPDPSTVSPRQVLPVVLGLVFFVRPLGYYVRQQSKLRLPWDELDDKKFHQPLNHAVASMCSTILTCYPSLITVLLASLSCEEDASGDAFLVVGSLESHAAANKRAAVSERNSNAYNRVFINPFTETSLPR